MSTIHAAGAVNPEFNVIGDIGAVNAPGGTVTINATKLDGVSSAADNNLTIDGGDTSLNSLSLKAGIVNVGDAATNTLSLKAGIVNVGDAATNTLSLKAGIVNVGDAATNTLSLNATSGVNINIPSGKLDLAVSTRTGTLHNPGNTCPLYVTSDCGAGSGGVEFRHSNGSQGIGFGHNTIYGTGSNDNQDLNIISKGSSTVNINDVFRVRTTAYGWRVGIGIADPKFPLDVLGWAYSWDGGGWNYFEGGLVGLGPQLKHDHRPHYDYQMSIRSQFGIWVTQPGFGFFTSSDSRSKTEIEIVNDNEALNMVNMLETKKYHYADPSRKKEIKTIGFIAQEVKKVLPNAVSIQHEYISDELRLLENLQWSQDDDKHILTIDDLELSDSHTGKCKFYVCNDADGKDEVMKEVDVNDDKKSFTFDQKYEKVFFYGKQVNDFHILDKNQIFALHHSAIQELSRKHDACLLLLEEENSQQDARLLLLEEENSQQDARLLLLEEENSQLRSRLDSLEAAVAAPKK